MSEFTLQKTSGRSTTSTVNQSQQNLSLKKKTALQFGQKTIIHLLLLMERLMNFNREIKTTVGY